MRPSVAPLPGVPRPAAGGHAGAGRARRCGAPSPDRPRALAEIGHDPARRRSAQARSAPTPRRPWCAPGSGRRPTPAFAAPAAEATGGNPLLLRSCSRARGRGREARRREAGVVAEIGPRAVRAPCSCGWPGSDEAAVAVARALAVLGDERRLPSVARSPGCGAGGGRATAALARAEILRAGAAARLRPPAACATPSTASRRRPSASWCTRVPPALLRDAGAPAEHVAAHLLLAPRARRGLGRRRAQRGRAQAATARGAADSAVAYCSARWRSRRPAERARSCCCELGVAEALTNGPAAAATCARRTTCSTDPRRRAARGHRAGPRRCFHAARRRGPPPSPTGRPRRAARRRPDERPLLEASARRDRLGAAQRRGAQALRRGAT